MISLVEGGHFSKTFSIFYIFLLNSKNRFFKPYFSTYTYPMIKTLLQIIRELNLLSFYRKNIIFIETFFSGYFIGNPSLRLSEVLIVFYQYLDNVKNCISTCMQNRPAYTVWFKSNKHFH